MKTFRLWLEPDKETPRFKRLAYEKTNVPLADVLQKGIHPWCGDQAHASLPDAFCDLLNATDAFPPGLKEMGYSQELSPATVSYYSSRSSHFEDTLERVRGSVLFAENLSYPELLGLAKDRLRVRWSSDLAHKLLRAAHPGFDDMRSWLKMKDASLKVASYAEVEALYLKNVLSLDDFDGEDSILIAEGIPTAILRQESALAKVADEQGRLRLVKSIRDFQMVVTKHMKEAEIEVTLNGSSDGHTARLIPYLTSDPRQRKLATNLAAKWRRDKGHYCFTVEIDNLERMATEEGAKVQFPTLAYDSPREGRNSTASVVERSVERYSIGKILTGNASGEALRAVLKAHGVSMTGRKEELIDKLARLAVAEYEKEKPNLGAFFQENRFLRLAGTVAMNSTPIPVLRGHALRNMLLMMYALRHLRGNVILEASHLNDSFDLLSLARALTKGEVTIYGDFVRVA